MHFLNIFPLTWIKTTTWNVYEIILTEFEIFYFTLFWCWVERHKSFKFLSYFQFCALFIKYLVYNKKFERNFLKHKISDYVSLKKVNFCFNYIKLPRQKNVSYFYRKLEILYIVSGWWRDLRKLQNISCNWTEIADGCNEK